MRRLAIIVLNWNGLAYTRTALASLSACRVPPGWQAHLMLVDNASSDGTVEVVRREFPQVEVLALDENKRFAGGNNAGIRRALESGADAIMLVNNDVEAAGGLLDHLLGAIERDPEAGAAGPLIFFDPPRDHIWYGGGVCIPALGYTAHRGLREVDRNQFKSIESTGYLTGCCLLASRAAWEKVGLLDERYFIYAEDADWSLRARTVGYRLLFVPRAMLYHKVSAASGAASPWKIYHRLRANWTLFATHARGIARLTWLPCFVAQQAALAVWLVARGQAAAARAVPRALWDAALGRPAAEVTL